MPRNCAIGISDVTVMIHIIQNCHCFNTTLRFVTTVMNYITQYCHCFITTFRFVKTVLIYMIPCCQCFITTFRFVKSILIYIMQCCHCLITTFRFMTIDLIYMIPCCQCFITTFRFVTAVVDLFPEFFRKKGQYRREIFIGVTAIISYLIGLSMVTNVSRDAACSRIYVHDWQILLL